MINPNYYKNSEIAEKLGISPMSITRYINQAMKGKLEIELIEHNGDWKIKKSDLNNLLLNTIVNNKAKFKNPIKFKSIKIPSAFYTKYNIDEQLEIMRDLKNINSINQKFAYLGENAFRYAEYQKSRKKNTLRSNLLYSNTGFFKKYSEQNKIKYNIFELGAMDLISSMSFIEELESENLIESYTSIDISPNLLNMSKEIILNKFPNLNFSSEIADIEISEIYDIVLDRQFSNENPNTVNIFLVIGSTLSNIKGPKRVYQSIVDSLQTKDFLIIDLIKEYPEMEKNKIYDPNNLFYNYISSTMLDMGFEDKDFEIISKFDEAKKQREVFAQLKYNIELITKLSVEPIQLTKGTEIQLSINRVDTNKDLSILSSLNMDLVNMNSATKLDYMNVVFCKK